MGEIAEMMLDGTLCEGCGEFIGDGGGYPVRCVGCSGRAVADHERVRATPPPPKKLRVSLDRNNKPIGIVTKKTNMANLRKHGVVAIAHVRVYEIVPLAATTAPGKEP